MVPVLSPNFGRTRKGCSILDRSSVYGQGEQGGPQRQNIGGIECGSRFEMESNCATLGSIVMRVTRERWVVPT